MVVVICFYDYVAFFLCTVESIKSCTLDLYLMLLMVNFSFVLEDVLVAYFYVLKMILRLLPWF